MQNNQESPYLGRSQMVTLVQWPRHGVLGTTSFWTCVFTNQINEPIWETLNQFSAVRLMDFITPPFRVLQGPTKFQPPEPPAQCCVVIFVSLSTTKSGVTYVLRESNFRHAQAAWLMSFPSSSKTHNIERGVRGVATFEKAFEGGVIKSINRCKFPLFTTNRL